MPEGPVDDPSLSEAAPTVAAVARVSRRRGRREREESPSQHRTAEHARLGTSSEETAGPWKEWGAYLSERAWGTVREDYSADGEAWSYFPHDDARSRTYRWSEDGLAGWCDSNQRLCLAVALWNGVDPILKERLFGLSGDEGNHGEDAKECWWYLDATPTHSWMRWRYHYPQRRFPYTALREGNAARGREDPELELLDTDAFDEDRYWCVTVDYAKASPDDVCMRITVRNDGPGTETIHVLPTLWFRNTWSWEPESPRPELTTDGTVILARHPELPEMALHAGAPPSPGGAPEVLVCENETNLERVFGVSASSQPTSPKDAIGDHVVAGTGVLAADGRGTKAAFHHVLSVAPGGEVELRVRLCRAGDPADMGDGFTEVLRSREHEADDFHATLRPEGCTEDEARVLRQAAAGMIWTQQFFHVDVAEWLDGDTLQPPPPESRHHGRNSGWRHLNACDVMSMPDAWEYPWFAAWDLAFHAVALAHLDPAFAKHQLVLLCREWFMHPNGQLPAYEWDYGDINPPVHAWAALRVFEIDGSVDHDFLARVFQKLVINFTWWVNRVDREGDNVFEGGFLGLDNVGPFNRSSPLPTDGILEQSDGTAWMAMYCLNLLEMALVLADHDRSYEDIATKFFEHFAYISTALNAGSLWDEVDGFYYDVVRGHDGSAHPLRVRSVVGLVPLFATMVIEPGLLAGLDRFQDRVAWFVTNRPELCASVSHVAPQRLRRDVPLVLSAVPAERLPRMLHRLFDPAEFLSAHGIRSLSRAHLAHPYEATMGGVTASVGYEPAESRSGLFGGNSNWRGPVWMPMNALVVESLRRLHEGFPWMLVEHPTGGGGSPSDLGVVADEISRRVVSLFLDDADGRRPAFGDVERLQRDPRWHDQLLFHEYFHGDTGAGLGASHQTGWTGLVIDLLRRRRSHVTGRDR